jgi:hypothetical protein
MSHEDNDNKTVLVIGLAVAVVLVVLLAGGSLVYFSALQAERAAAEEERAMADAQQAEAEARRQEAVARAKEQAAEAERAAAAAAAACEPFLPEGLGMDSEFGVKPDADANGKGQVTTVRKKLVELQAHCKRGVIYDGTGKRVVFVLMPGELATEPRRRGQQPITPADPSGGLDQQGYTVVRMWPVAPPK